MESYIKKNVWLSLAVVVVATAYLTVKGHLSFLTNMFYSVPTSSIKKGV